MKKEVEKLFGKGSYNKADFVINFSEEYIYENSSRYVLGCYES